MEKYFKRLDPPLVGSSQDAQARDNEQGAQGRSKRPCITINNIDVNKDELPMDPGLRPSILSYHHNVRDEIRRFYWQKGPFRSMNFTFPWRACGAEKRWFIGTWFNDHPRWLEYSIEKDAAFCLCCYLFKPEHGDQSGGDYFVTKGFSDWKNKWKLDNHVGGPNNIHNKCFLACEALFRQEQHIDVALHKQSDQARHDYHTMLTAPVDCVRFLIRQGLPFRGHDESNSSKNQGNFLELLSFLAKHNKDIDRVVLDNALGNLKMKAPSIQKEIVQAAAIETTNVIIEDMRDELFSIMVDDSRDISIREQMAICLRYVNKKGQVIESFLGVVHVAETSAETLKAAIDFLFSKHGLSISSLRGQGYDGASNMQGEFKGLKSLILSENKCAYYVHCFAHQLQLTLVAVAKKNIQVGSFFNIVGSLANMCSASCKRRDILQDKQFIELIHGISHGDLVTGRGLNQETTIKRPGDTRWSSHYDSLLSVVCNFSPAISMLEVIVEDGTLSEQRSEAHDLLNSILCFEFVFMLHLMIKVLRITNELSQALQRKDQNLVNAMNMVGFSKKRLQALRDKEWHKLLAEVCLFCESHDIMIPKMEDMFVLRGRSRRHTQDLTNLHHYQVDLFYAVIDMQLQELNGRFNEVNTDLLSCMACLDPSNSFSTFDKGKLVTFAKFYPSEFSPAKLIALDNQLETYIMDVSTDADFANVKDIGGLAEKLVERKKDQAYPLVYLLLKLALILPVATATVEKAFSALKIIKTSLRNKMEDDWLNDLMVTYIERDIFNTIDNESIIRTFQNLKNRRGVLPRR